MSSSNCSHYFLTIIDNASHATWVYLICEREETSQLLKNFIAMTKNQFRKSVKIVRSDNGSKFTSTPMQVFYQENGIPCQSSCIKTPQKNGRVKQNITMF